VSCCSKLTIYSSYNDKYNYLIIIHFNEEGIFIILIDGKDDNHLSVHIIFETTCIYNDSVGTLKLGGGGVRLTYFDDLYISIFR